VAGPYGRFFEIVEVLVQITALVCQRNDWIGDDLARAVEGDITASLHLYDGNFSRGHDVFCGRSFSAEGEDGLVLYKNQCVGNFSSNPRFQDLYLSVPGGLVVEAA